jgi:hypothetical protein
MTTPPQITRSSAAGDRRGAPGVYGPLALIAILYCVMSWVGIGWGLPSRAIDPYLFGEGEVWSGEKIHRLSRAGDKFSAKNLSRTGADVDIDGLGRKPRSGEAAKGILLTESDESVARIYLRYRLYTHQPDEMITMMALAGMRPGAWDFDPRLYQYGGLFIYPVGAVIRLCGALGLIDVRSDPVFYLDHPDEFGKFYVVARAYSAAWGLLGVFLVFAITRRLAIEVRNSNINDQEIRFEVAVGKLATPANLAGMIAALLFTMMPVVVCTAHEGKPHLPGAALMLLAVYLAMRSLVLHRQSTIGIRKFFWLTCLSCGAATGMVLSSWPICALIPVVAAMEWRMKRADSHNVVAAMRKAFLGVLIAVAAYFATNPYVLINFFSNREILNSNFGNSLAMYEIDRVGEGLIRVFELMLEGATLPVVVLGFVAGVVSVLRHRQVPHLWLAIVPAFLFFAQFVLIGAGKPDEYGRFGIFTLSIVVIGASCLLFARPMKAVPGALAGIAVAAWVALAGSDYLRAFSQDSGGAGTRTVAAEILATQPPGTVFAVAVEPAPYCCPPLSFATRKVLLIPEAEPDGMEYLRVQVDPGYQPARISWASKRFTIEQGPARGDSTSPIPPDPSR